MKKDLLHNLIIFNKIKILIKEEAIEKVLLIVCSNYNKFSKKLNKVIKFCLLYKI